MIFFGGSGSPVVAENQQLATENIPKSLRNSKKSVKYFPWDPGFSAFALRAMADTTARTSTWWCAIRPAWIGRKNNLARCATR
jgi:hypothetical protein